MNLEEIKAKSEQGDSESQFTLGNIYANAQGVQQSPIEACKWWQLAANQGHDEAQSSLELMYTLHHEDR